LKWSAGIFGRERRVARQEKVVSRLDSRGTSSEARLQAL
jgi:hypothetical protein